MMMVIDVHAHLGWDYTFDEAFTEEELIQKIELYDVGVQIVQPGTCHTLEQVRSQHDAIAELCRTYGGKFFGMANPSPHLLEADYRGEIRRCIEELGFIAIKLHPLASGVNPGSRAGRKAFDSAREFNVPLMVHTGAGVPFAGPVNLIPLAQEYAGLKIIMAHCGQIVFANEAAAVFEACPNVYGDTSWSPGFVLKNWCRTYGPRFMLGTDHADNTGTELAKIRTVGLTPHEQKQFLETTARKVFGIFCIGQQHFEH
jgi:predicted TIM-barrel fold metal-dependent hydrolase